MSARGAFQSLKRGASKSLSASGESRLFTPAGLKPLEDRRCTQRLAFRFPDWTSLATRALVASMMVQPDLPILDADEVQEARLRLGILASALLEEAHVLCTEVGAAMHETASERLTEAVEDAAILTRAIAVLARRGT